MRRPPSPRLRHGLADRTDAQLLRLAREGDPLAYEAIVARYREPLRRACARIVPDRAEDAVQQTLLSAWLALERGADVRELRPWLYSIARNAAIDQARGIRSELVELGPEVAGGEDPAQAEARRREVTEVLEAVAALPERQRQALIDTALHGRATEAVAVDLGLSGGALRQLVHRARTAVRAAVPTVAFPVPAWLAELLGEEGTRRGVVLLGSGSGAAVLAKATATVATVGAVVAGGIGVDRYAVAHHPPRATHPAVADAGGSGAGAPAPGSRVTHGTLLANASILPLRQAGIGRGDASAPTSVVDRSHDAREPSGALPHGPGPRRDGVAADDSARDVRGRTGPRESLQVTEPGSPRGARGDGDHDGDHRWHERSSGDGETSDGRTRRAPRDGGGSDHSDGGGDDRPGASSGQQRAPSHADGSGESSGSQESSWPQRSSSSEDGAVSGSGGSGTGSSTASGASDASGSGSATSDDRPLDATSRDISGGAPSNG